MKAPEFIARLKRDPLLHWNPKRNKSTLRSGYFIEYAGSLFLGQPNSQNTVDEILELGRRYGFEPFTKVAEVVVITGERLWEFHGNCRQVSNAFRVWVWRPKLARRLKRALRQSLKLDNSISKVL